ncbi:MAG: hypothetical protein U1C59_10875, partial [Methylotenera sp.]|nr:hypothetical protein [Methylotenera sp.]
CTAPQVFNTATNTCGTPPPPCVAGAGDLNGAYYTTGCVNGCEHFAQGSGIYTTASNGEQFYYLSLRENTGQTCASDGLSKASIDGDAKAAIAQAEATAQNLLDAQLAARAAENQAANQAKLDAAAAAGAAANAAQRAADTAAAVAAAAKDKATRDANAASAAAAYAASVSSNPDSTQSERDNANASASAAAGLSSISGSVSDSASAASTAANAAASSAAGASAAASNNPTQADKPKSLCETNPKIAACQIPGVDAGYCNNGTLSGFSCSGDGIACALLRGAAFRDCKIQKDQDKYLHYFNGAATNGAIPSNGLLTNSRNINITSLNNSTPFGRSCPPDVNFAVAGHTITMPVSDWCPYLALVGDVFLALAYLWAARTLVGAV